MDNTATLSYLVDFFNMEGNYKAPITNECIAIHVGTLLWIANEIDPDRNTRF
mgnify:CR=1 FL=1